MTGASLIGFAVVFALVCGTTSVACLALLPLARRAAVQRRVATLAAVLPVALASAVVAILVVASLVGTDHCAAHGHHAHLCLVHGAVWADRPWAVALVAAAGATLGTRIVVLAAGAIRARYHLKRLNHVASAGDVRIVDSERVFCFVAGLVHPAIYVSTKTRATLSDDEWDAMLAHEHGHIAHRDLAHRVLLEIALLFAAPLVAITIRERWDEATERLRDADAAAQVSSDAVASALVHMVRAGRAPRFVAAFGPQDRLLASRVHALVDDAPLGEAAARRIAIVAGSAITALVLAAMACAEPLHHALETLLG